MKLIDLLVQELPKRGGWTRRVDESILLHAVSWCMPPWGCSPIAYRLSTHEIVTREQYEAALAAAQPQWDGEGLPPVGCECEYTLSGNTWWPCKIEMYVGTQGVVMSCDVFEGIQYVNCHEYTNLAFRPIRSEADKKRDAAINAIAELCRSSATNGHSAELIYADIAAGKIPGIRIE